MPVLVRAPKRRSGSTGSKFLELSSWTGVWRIKSQQSISAAPLEAFLLSSRLPRAAARTSSICIPVAFSTPAKIYITLKTFSRMTARAQIERFSKATQGNTRCYKDFLKCFYKDFLKCFIFIWRLMGLNFNVYQTRVRDGSLPTRSARLRVRPPKSDIAE